MGNEVEKFEDILDEEGRKIPSEGSLFCIVESPAFIDSKMNPAKHVAFVIHNRTDSKYILTELVPSLETLNITAKSKFKVVVKEISLKTLEKEYLERIQIGKKVNCEKTVRLVDVKRFAEENFFKGECICKGNEEEGYEIFPVKSGYNSSYSLLAWIGTNCQNYAKDLMKYFCGEDQIFQYEVGRGIIVGAGALALVGVGLYGAYSLLRGEKKNKSKKKEDVDEGDFGMDLDDD